ncbi:MAG: winged helix-turn-helix domain-containing protein [Terriglobales bacterium]
MQITERVTGDIDTLLRLARREKDAEQKDRCLVGVHACRGVEAAEIQRMLARSRGFVQRWAYAYRDGGIEGLKQQPRPGRTPKLPRAREAELKARLDAGPRVEDGVCTLRGKDVRRILDQEFGVKYTLDGIYPLLHRLGYSCLAPRPRHEKQDVAAQKKFKEESAPFLSAR